MTFDKNHPIIFVLVAIIILVVMAQSVFFLLRALKRAKQLGMDKAKIKKTVISSSVFTIAPAISIVICVITLAKDLGVAVPWLRLSVIGSLSYETVAANNALSGMGLKLGDPGLNLNASQFVTIVFVMTISIMVGLLLAPIIGKKLQKGLISIGKKDKNWVDIFQNSMFIGMIAAFLGFVFCDFSNVFKGDTSALIPVFVMLSSAIIMALCGLVMKLTKWKWINDYALPISMVAGMALAIPFTAWLG
ncbi:MAG: DUF5058 family protein [Clostridia bacterium]|nr:DUF5058 family protein [Clostridia bacterium]